MMKKVGTVNLKDGVYMLITKNGTLIRFFDNDGYPIEMSIQEFAKVEEGVTVLGEVLVGYTIMWRGLPENFPVEISKNNSSKVRKHGALLKKLLTMIGEDE